MLKREPRHGFAKGAALEVVQSIVAVDCSVDHELKVMRPLSQADLELGAGILLPKSLLQGVNIRGLTRAGDNGYRAPDFFEQ